MRPGQCHGEGRGGERVNLVKGRRKGTHRKDVAIAIAVRAIC